MTRRIPHLLNGLMEYVDIPRPRYRPFVATDTGLVFSDACNAGGAWKTGATQWGKVGYTEARNGEAQRPPRQHGLYDPIRRREYWLAEDESIRRAAFNEAPTP